ncbi:PSD1 and planctomycete cytochrome C domain-containing protein [Mariniblastus fucicola]|uniref:Planctomycete cytochrome C n=1 Tax=Mariniblastus fucicola TaxID=980251 RepID=A0A5B9PI36_9BACT|nr:PSD1 and planctomycete cytochrome C domain-containing protein [Mariniblastus fucicola]QEG24336.1 Planctomycete cytochrome C [Mariniblastus fucicola]
MMKSVLSTLSFSLVTMFSACALFAQDDGADFFSAKVKPILEQHCFECHRDDPDDLGGDLALASRESMLTGGDSGSLIDEDSPGDSLLLRTISYEDDAYQMPPEGKLSDEEISVLTKWVELGLPWNPDDEIQLEQDHADGPPQVNDETKSWWSFQKVERPAVPKVTDSTWCRNEIDAFLLAGLENENLQPAPDATKRTLVRRAWYDLVGLPPTPEQVEAFVKDDSPDAWESLIDELLASPHYGEKWGRHWMDLVGYAESNSFERDDTKPFVWGYRDYVIRSLNEDKPYDQFLTEQLAGDELPEVSIDTVTATGFYRLGSWDDEPADRELAKYDELDRMVAVVGQSMMGLTVDCARCHDHKIDPIPQADYYQMVSFFQNVRSYGVRDHNSVLAASVTQMDERKIDDATRLAHEKEVAAVEARMDAIATPVKEDFEPVDHEEFKHLINRERVLKKYVGKSLTEELFAEYKKLREQWRQLTQNPPQGIRKILCVKEHGAEPPESFVMIRGNPHAPGKSVSPKFLSVLSPPEPEIVPPADGETTGRRLAFAKWLTSPEHPLTARVMANRLWQYHFGRGIVRTSSDFGFQGMAPTQPELLDWLASELVDGGWRLKSMHRKIMLSRAYQMSTTFSDDSYAVDPENDHFWRFNPRRLTAEEIRDSILFVSGQLNLDTVYGPSVYPPMPQEVLDGQSMPGKNWHTSNDVDSRRRSLYIHIKRSMGVPILESNDAATNDSPCPVRFVTTQPTQAIGLINSEFTNRQARLFADSIRAEHTDAKDQVAAVLRRVFQREPTAVEIDRGVALMNESSLKKKPEEALNIFCLLALNLNEFVYLQ